MTTGKGKHRFTDRGVSRFDAPLRLGEIIRIQDDQWTTGACGFARVGITGWVTDLQRGQALRQALLAIPLDRRHLETDAPYLFPKNAGTRRGHNEPANLPWVAVSVAELMGRDVDEIIQAYSSNSRRMFDLPGN